LVLRFADCDLRSAVSFQHPAASRDLRFATRVLRPAICEIRALGRCNHAALTAKSSLSAAAASGNQHRP